MFQVSITFDPFLYLSLPMPKRQRLLPVTFMWRDAYKKPVRVGSFYLSCRKQIGSKSEFHY